MLYGRLVHVGKLSTDLQILNYELHKNAFGGRAPPRPAEGAIALPRPLAVIRRREGRERVGNRYGEEEEGRKGREGVGWGGKGKRGMEGG